MDAPTSEVDCFTFISGKRGGRGKEQQLLLFIIVDNRSKNILPHRWR
jgi:hypothetical protein